MVDGRLFDLNADMAEIGGQGVPAPEFYWQRHRDGQHLRHRIRPHRRLPLPEVGGAQALIARCAGACIA
jgi:hypothetical protein